MHVSTAQIVSKRLSGASASHTLGACAKSWSVQHKRVRCLRPDLRLECAQLSAYWPGERAEREPLCLRTSTYIATTRLHRR